MWFDHTGYKRVLSAGRGEGGASEKGTRRRGHQYARVLELLQVYRALVLVVSDDASCLFFASRGMSLFLRVCTLIARGTSRRPVSAIVFFFFFLACPPVGFMFVLVSFDVDYFKYQSYSSRGSRP